MNRNQARQIIKSTVEGVTEMTGDFNCLLTDDQVHAVVDSLAMALAEHMCGKSTQPSSVDLDEEWELAEQLINDEVIDFIDRNMNTRSTVSN